VARGKDLSAVTDNLRGILAVLVASVAFVLNDTFVKLVSDELPSGEIIVVRGVLATVMLAVGVVAFGAVRPVAVLFTPMMLLRLASAAGATVFIVISLRYLPLATVITVLQVTPLAVTAGAAIIYREKVGWARWLAALTGFLGVVLIIRPTGGGGIAMYLALTTLIFTTMRDLTTRGLHHDIPSIFVAAASAAAITLAGFLVSPFDTPWSMPSGPAWALMTVSAACLFVANTSIIMAMRTGELSVVAPFRYAMVPLSILLGYWLWGDMPDAVAFLGIGLVLGAGLYALHRERRSLMGPRAATPQRSPAE
jgi:drug/metabolite transporter (DMT)-like permease